MVLDPVEQLDAFVDALIEPVDLLDPVLDLHFVLDDGGVLLDLLEAVQLIQDLTDDDGRSTELGVLLNLTAQDLLVGQVLPLRGCHIAGDQFRAIEQLEGPRLPVHPVLAEHRHLDVFVYHSGKLRIVLHDAIEPVEILEQGVVAGQHGVGRQLIGVVEDAAGGVQPRQVHTGAADQHRRDQQQRHKYRDRTLAVPGQSVKKLSHLRAPISPGIR